MLLAILKKKKKVSLNILLTKITRTRDLDCSPLVKVMFLMVVMRKRKMDRQIADTATSSLAVLAEVAQSQSSQSSLPDLIGEQNSGADCPCEEDEEMPSLEGEEVTEL